MQMQWRQREWFTINKIKENKDRTKYYLGNIHSLCYTTIIMHEMFANQLHALKIYLFDHGF